jgi:hypothetical protein
MRIDTLAVAGKFRQFLTHRLLLLFQAGLACVELYRETPNSVAASLG